MPFFQLHVLPSQIKIQERYYFALPELPLISSQPQMIMIIFLSPLVLFVFISKESFTPNFKFCYVHSVLSSFFPRQDSFFYFYFCQAFCLDLVVFLAWLFDFLHKRKQSQNISRIYFGCLSAYL